MSEKPITQRIKDRLAAYTAMLRDIDNQLERLDRMEMTMASPPGPDLTGMPRGSGTPSDRTGMMVERKMSLNELASRVGISNVNLSKIKNNKVTAIRFSTLAAICEALECEAGDILEFQKESAD